MSAFGRGNRRSLLLSQGVSGVAAALAASLAWAEAAPTAEPSSTDPGARVPLLSPEAPPSLGDVGDPSPVVAVFNASRALGDGASRLTLFADSKLDFTRVGEIATVDNAAHANRAQPRANEAAEPAAEDCATVAAAPGPVGALSEGLTAQDNPPPGFAAAPKLVGALSEKPSAQDNPPPGFAAVPGP